mgnify:CR=1 FL=1
MTTGDALALWLAVVVLVAAACRATQILLHDRILQAPRAWLTRKVNPRGLKPGHPELGYLGYLIQCPWCLSIWIGLALVVGLSWNLPWLSVPWLVGRLAVALALSLAAVVADRLIDKHASDEDAAARAVVVYATEDEPPPVVAAALAAATGDESTTGRG